jgi:ABC-type lipoprotein export system ATPase subunit
MGLSVEHVGKFIGDPPTRILTDISMQISDGDFVALTGRSGSGKSTLLYLMSSLDNPTEGKISIDGQDLMSLDDESLHVFRNQNMGFVFQFHYLISELSAFENVLMPARKFSQQHERKAYAESLLLEFGLADKMHRYPRQLSGGEQQRLAIARALIMEPKYLFADEPTGSLDSANGETVLRILKEVNEKKHTTVVMVTHDSLFASQAKKRIQLKDGQIES